MQPKEKSIDSSDVNVNASVNGQAEQRVISQSLNSSSVPIPTVTVADNRHILPSSFLNPHSLHGDPHQRSFSDTLTMSNATSRNIAQSQSSQQDSDSTIRPRLYERPAQSWGATTVNKDLRNEVFTDAFWGQPIPIQSHKKPASRTRSLVHRQGSGLRNSNSESSLKNAQQSQISSLPPVEESIRRRAIKAAAERRNGLVALTPIKSVGEEGSDVEEGDFDEKAGTSAP